MTTPTAQAVPPSLADSQSVRTIGIAGGGQLAQMMLPAARALGLRAVVLDPDPDCSSASGADGLIVGSFDSEDALFALAEQCDVITFEIEKINVDALQKLEEGGQPVRPSSSVLRIIQDKLVQKRFLREHNIPTSSFEPLDKPSDFSRALPCVWKARRDGYDGRGVAILRDDADIAALPDSPALLEDLVAIDIELAVMIARDVNGSVLHYPVVEIIMDQQAHVMDSLIAPADVAPAVIKECQDLAAKVAQALDYVGVLALEFFVDGNGKVYVNELSPRPHNSGHYTIEATATSQFEQHVRAVAGLELGSVELLKPALTFNVLGAPGALGRPDYIGFDGWPAEDAIYVHSYAKPQVRPGRKMGHVTVLGETRAEVINKAQRIRAHIRVESQD